MGHGATTVVLAGELDQAAVGDLVGYCRGLATQGRHHLAVDMAGVVGCDHEGLVGLGELAAGSSGLMVRLVGARWSQFLPALLAVAVADLDAERDRVRAVLGTGGRRAQRARGPASSIAAETSAGSLAFGGVGVR